jgi:hypothetical protein
MPVTNDAVPGHDPPSPPTLGQRFYDNVFLLLVLGIVIMLPVFTGWGLWEIVTMPQGTLP